MLLLAALFATATPAPSLTPADIYRSALRRLTTLAQPRYIDTTEHRIVVSETPKGNIPAAWDERVLYDSAARRECVMLLPYSDKSQVLFSQAYFAPDMWSLRRPPAISSTPAHSEFEPDLSDLRTIAAIVAVAKPSYDITLAGINKLTNGGSAYHLVLKPLNDPTVHNLRELWVDSVNFNIMRAVLAGSYAPEPGARVEPSTVTEDFGAVGPYWVVIHRAWTYRDMLSRITMHLDSTETKMSFPREIPAWYFDQAQFDAHRSQVNPTSQWP
ncbi:MAG TPA: hypothetical protein VFN37_04550 [Candidatus Baltobacteraceae bacterium]|nr:hypothetical protein [Candidatus Baltobacteraceae bacterium]